MSIAVMSWVWSNSKTKGSARLVLLALADNANDDGVCWPSIATVAKKANLERRYVIDILKQLENDGEIKVERRRNGKLNKSNVYMVVMPASLPSVPGITTPSEAGDTRVVMPASPEPSMNQHLEPSKKHKSSKETTPAEILTPVVQALATVTNTDINLNYPRLAKEAKALVVAGYTSEQITKTYSPGGRWFNDDWRGQKGNIPSLAAIRDTILKLTNGNGTSARPAIESY